MSDNPLNKTDAAWKKLFEKYDILTRINAQGRFEITSTQINEFRESRLMAYCDHRTTLPRLFRKHGLSILPVTRGRYMILPFDAYQDLAYDHKVKSIEMPFPEHLDSLNPTNIYSEAAALNCAFACGMIDDLMGEESVQTISGKMATNSFEFMISLTEGGKTALKVSRSQCEIDGGYESANKLLLVEAKNFLYDDFLIRQLYYPYRLWKEYTGKEVIPTYLTFSNDVFAFFLYRFNRPEEYDSIELVRQVNFIVKPESITLGDIQRVVETTKLVRESSVPFPQADSFERVVDLLGVLMVEDLTKEEITNRYVFDARQTDYYTNAGRYLGLIDKKREEIVGISFSLSKRGQGVMGRPHKNKYLGLCECLLEHEIFNKALRLYLKKAGPPTIAETVGIMRTCPIYRVESDDTYERRAQTVVKWIDWILSLAEG